MTAWHPYHPPFKSPTLARHIAALEANLDKRPDDPELHHNLGCWLYTHREFLWAEKNLRFALAVDSNHIKSLLSLGTMRATCPDSSFRSSSEAVALTGAAYELAKAGGLTSSEWVVRHHLQALAAAYAESQDWGLAVSSQNEAIASTSTRSHVPVLTERLLGYLQCRPLRLTSLSL